MYSSVSFDNHAILHRMDQNEEECGFDRLLAVENYLFDK